MALWNRAIMTLCAAVGLGGGVAVGNAIVWQRERSRASKEQLLEEDEEPEEKEEEEQEAVPESGTPAPDDDAPDKEVAPPQDDPAPESTPSHKDAVTKTSPATDTADPKIAQLITLAGSMLQLVSDRSASRKVLRECIHTFRDLRQNPESSAVAETLVPAQARLTQLVEYELPPLVKKDQAASLRTLSSEFLEVVKQLVQEIMNDANLHLTSAEAGN